MVQWVLVLAIWPVKKLRHKEQKDIKKKEKTHKKIKKLYNLAS
jgi:hypothetical protein